MTTDKTDHSSVYNLETFDKCDILHIHEQNDDVCAQEYRPYPTYDIL